MAKQSGRSRSGRPTLRDVAKAASVSVATASRAMSGTHRVRPDLLDRVRRAARELGYRPHVGARSLRSARSMAFGVILADLSSPVELEILKGLGTASQQHGYVLLVTDAQGSAEQYRSLTHQLYERRIDGLFIATPPDLGDAVQEFIDSGTPTLALFTRDRSLGAVPLLTTREEEATTAAIMRLAELGHRRFAYLSGTLSQRSGRARILERATAEAVGREGALEVVPVDGSEDTRATIRAIAQRPAEDAPTSLFCDHRNVPDVLNELRGLGKGVPADLSIVSFSDSEWVQWLSPPISTVRTDATAVGRLAANMMSDWIDGSPPPNVVAAESAEWVERASVGPAPNGSVAAREG